jgi:DNA-binding NtrC family response regulator
MPADPLRVLVVEDEPDLARLYAEHLRREHAEAVLVETGGEALAQLGQGGFDLVLLDINLPDMNGLDLLRRLGREAARIAVIVITGHGSVNLAVEAMRSGAYDFLVKPFAPERFLVTLRNALERQRLARLVDTYREDRGRDGDHGFVGTSPRMQMVYRLIDSAASSKATVFITGESGTGKELCAEAVHRTSPRRDKPFVAINCAAIPNDLMESEIFGHVKGAFTGAIADREGAARRAHGGTLFLDEVCEMDPGLQTKLLRFVQTGTFTRVGGAELEAVDVRFVCATNRDPMAEVRAGRFREDLYYRLHVIPITLPPLRERAGDVPLIAHYFLERYAREEGKDFSGLTEETDSALAAYGWPGNIRELQNVMRSLVVLNGGGWIGVDLLPEPLKGGMATPSEPVHAPGAVLPLWLIEKRAIEQTIAICGGNVLKAAELLRISPSTIYRKRQAWQGGAGR